MSERGKPSEAHEYERGQCIYCHSYKNVIDSMSLECTPERERITDEAREKRKSQTQ